MVCFVLMRNCVSTNNNKNNTLGSVTWEGNVFGSLPISLFGPHVGFPISVTFASGSFITSVQLEISLVYLPVSH
jgi:hypothetical protein